MVIKAVVNSRVSTAEQLLSNSLDRQTESVEKAAKKLGVVIPPDGRWAGSVSSKAGTNVTRKDLLAMLDYCKSHPDVKYAIFDEYDRYMRSVNEGPYFEVLFQQLGVKVWYASESDAFNGNDAMAKFMRTMSAYRAEGSNEERQKKSISGHEKAIRDGRYTFPPKPGYVKGSEPGIHIPHHTTFKLLQAAFREVISGLYTPLEARKRLNETNFTKFHAAWPMDKFRRFATDPYYAGMLAIDRQVKASNPRGLHEQMLSVEEHEELVRIFKGTLKIRGAKKQYNPEFPMNKILTCGDCGIDVKFTGSKKSNGYAKKTTKYYWKYRCRGCGKEFHRDEVHSLVSERLKEVSYTGSQQAEFKKALETVWRQRQKDKLLEIRLFEKRLKVLQETKSKLVIEMVSSDARYKADIEQELDSIKNNIVSVESSILELKEIDKELVEFIDFGISYTDKLVSDWWELGYEDRVRCQHLIFPGGISLSSNRKISTPQISLLYTLKPNKKDLSKVEKSLMVELADTASASGLLTTVMTTGLDRLEFLKHRYKNDRKSRH